MADEVTGTKPDLVHLDKLSPEELKREIYRLRKERTNLRKQVETKESIIDYLRTAQEDRMAMKVAEAVERVLPNRGIRRLG
ncbi:MAG: hypothetical protein HGB01_06855 [Chlorobiaceae bacterium]|nr:hypothetical protein [Chlorobiaceae bacterium]